MIDTSPNQNRCELDKIKDFVVRKRYNLIGEVINLEHSQEEVL